MSKKKIYFRADACQSIGYGHFIRSIALADMLKDDFECTFFTQTPTEYQKEEAEMVCSLVTLPADDTHFELFLEKLNGDEIVVLDNYFFTSEYQKLIKDRGCKLVCIDDIHDRHFFADVIINHCINYCSDYDAEEETKFFLGAKWALLRAPFLKKEESQQEANHWVITFGGSDPYNLTLEYVKCLKQKLPKAKISVLIGDGYTHHDELKTYNDVKIYNKLSAQQVAELFRSAGNVVCSASSVCYEALSCGCNVHAGYYVDNQVDFYNNLITQDLILPLGNLSKNETALKLEENQHTGQVTFTDIAERHRRVFRALSLDVVKYQDMTEEQSRKTWECRNKEVIRRWMTNTEPFSFDSHCKFVKGLEENPAMLYYSFFDGNQFVGSYDFVGIEDNNVAERGLFVNPDYQGKQMAIMMENYLDGEIIKRGVKRLTAEVLKENYRSYKYHLLVGYKVYNEDEKYFYLERYI
jgi:UDP-2,4-diacetamido-2,4,6-trideoxy-beta-L-altropyranose hydrolase